MGTEPGFQGPSERRKVGTWRGRIGWSLAGVLVTFVLFEVVLRTAGWAYVQWHSGEHRGDARYTILCAGDSFVFGIGGLDFPSQLEAQLNTKAGQRLFHVINAGVPGENTAMLADNLDDLIAKYRADAVVVISGENNSWNSIRLSGGGQKLPWTFRVEQVLLHSRTYKFFKLMTIGLFHHTFHEWWDADRALEKIALYLNDVGDTPHLPPPAKGADIGRQAHEAMEAGHFEEAVRLFRSFLAINPDYPDAYADAASALLRLDRTDEAAALLQEGLRNCPANREQLFLTLGRAYERKNDRDRAIDVFKQGLQAVPQSMAIYQELVKQYTTRGQTWAVLDFVRDNPAIASNPLHPYVVRLHEKDSDPDLRLRVSAGLENDIHRMFAVTRRRDVPLIVGSYPRNDIAEVHRATLEEGGVYVDFTQSFSARFSRPEDYISKDGCHCNTTGYGVMAEILGAEVERQLRAKGSLPP